MVALAGFWLVVRPELAASPSRRRVDVSALIKARSIGDDLRGLMAAYAVAHLDEIDELVDGPVSTGRCGTTSASRRSVPPPGRPTQRAT
jgi:hypothetical protein